MENGVKHHTINRSETQGELCKRKKIRKIEKHIEKFVSERAENIAEKGENTGNQHFFFLQCFENTLFCRFVKTPASVVQG